MRLIKAFVRTTRLDEVVHALRGAGAPGVTVSRGHGVGYGYESFSFTLAPGEVNQAPEVAKLEVVCREEQVDALVGAIVDNAGTGCAGDGIVFVSPVERAVRIRSREAGSDALEPPANEPPANEES